jgi:hypothetical protein
VDLKEDGIINLLGGNYSSKFNASSFLKKINCSDKLLNALSES